ncbi:MAG TPA: glycosyltransferase [Gemmatimonadales bacterium]|nr:glycosyltransferase [Gemmatimonadales bacterium]
MIGEGSTTLPTVSVLTPVYNGERYLQQCIESVLSQTYGDFEYVILDNGSTDRTPEIAARFARSDSRIRVHRNPTTVPVNANFNRVGGLATPGTRYLKYLAADDLLFPDCLKLMVEVAESSPAIALVASYKIHGNRAVVDGPPFPDRVIDGREACKLFFQGHLGVLGSPSNHLIRREALPADGPIFDESFYHADTELFVRLLKEGQAYAFVHQVLTLTREHEATLSATFSDRMGSRGLESLVILERYGRSFLRSPELEALSRSRRMDYLRWLFRARVKLWDREVWQYQASRRAEFGLNVGMIELIDAALREVGASVWSPRDALRTIRRAFSG